MSQAQLHVKILVACIASRKCVPSLNLDLNVHLENMDEEDREISDIFPISPLSHALNDLHCMQNQYNTHETMCHDSEGVKKPKYQHSYKEH